jgi:hypothetical protein
MSRDKQLRGIRFETVLEKSRRDQALNAKEFAVLAGIAYSTAREWFNLPGFPRVQGVVFWQDFVEWRKVQNRGRTAPANFQPSSSSCLVDAKRPPPQLPQRAAQILLDSTK